MPTLSVGIATATTSSFSVTSDKSVTVGLATATTSAFSTSIVSGEFAVVGIATANVSAFTATSGKLVAVGIGTVNTTAVPLSSAFTITWPTTLPDFENPLFNVYSEKQGTTTIRSQFDVGPANTRQRTTASIDRLELGYIMDKTQLDTFVTFYESTSKHGAIKFDAIHPRTETLIAARFVSRPDYEPIGANKFRVTFNVEVLPS